MSQQNALTVAGSLAGIGHEVTVTYAAGKAGQTRERTVAAAIVAGGKAAAALRDAALVAAASAAQSGRYRSAAEILADGFPSVAKLAEKWFVGGSPWANKANMASFVRQVALTPPRDAAKGYTPRQARARFLLAMLADTFPESMAQAGQTVEAQRAEPAPQAPAATVAETVAPVPTKRSRKAGKVAAPELAPV